MGKVIRTGLQVECDRSGKMESVTDEKMVKFYEEFSGNRKSGDAMFMAVLATPEGVRRISFDFLGPKSLDAVGKYLDKIDPPKKKKDESEEPKPKKPKKQQKGAVEEKAEDPDEEEVEEEEEEAEVSDDELFEDDDE